MAYMLAWLVEDRVLYARFTGRLRVEELEQFIHEEHALIEKGTPLVHFINDSRYIEGIDFNLRMLQVLVQSLKHPEGIGWHIDIINSPINRMFAALAGQFARVRCRQFYDLQEALAFLKASDSTLADMDVEALVRKCELAQNRG